MRSRHRLPRSNSGSLSTLRAQMRNALLQELADDFRDFGAVRLQREVTGVEKADLRLGNVAPEGLGAWRQEKRIILAPNGEKRRAMLTEVRLEPRVERHIRGVIEEEIELDLVDAWPCQ